MNDLVYGLSKKTWWSIFLSINFFSFVLMAGTLASKSWVYTTMNMGLTIYSEYDDWDNNLIDFGIFEGNLYRCTFSCTETYKKLKKEYCGAAKNFVLNYPEYYFVCPMFKNLHKGMKSYLVCEGFAMFCIFLLGIFLILTRKRWNLVMRIIVFSLLGLATVSHYTGFISWMSTTNTNFNRDCSDNPSKGYFDLSLCAGDGPALSLFVAIFLPVFFVFFCFISRKFQQNFNQVNVTEVNKDEVINPEKQEDNVIDGTEKDIQMTVIKNET